jgi:F-type H+-transporting ATPase subunit alpha
MIKTYSPVLFLMCSTLLWRRSDNVVFALLLGGSDLVTIGDGVECKVRAILQVVDESAGPSTKKEYHLTTVPVGEALRGQVVDYLGRPLSPDGKLHNGTPQANTHQLGTESRLPLINRQPDMESREQITEALVTGVKALDILTPLGRGQALQVSGPKGSGKTQLCLDAILGQQGAGVCCFYAAVGCTGDQLSRTVAQLEEHKAMGYTTVVAAPSDRSLGEQYAAMLTACSMAEAVRDAGGHALVVLNDVSVAVRMWEMITVAMADLGSVALDVLQTGSNANASGERQDGEDDAMVEYEGMLVSVAAAQRRRFFSSMIQRCAKMHRRLKGGSLTGLFVVPGCPAGSGDLTGELSSKRLEAMKQKVRTYRHLTEEQKDKLLHALEKPASTSARASDTSQDVATEHQIFSLSDIRASQELRTEIVEEFMSIVDGQIVLKRPSEVGMDLKDKDKSKPHAGVLVDPRASLSRIGSRAHPPALVDLAPTIRFDLLQAEDARRFAAAAAMQLEGRHTKTLHRADIVKAALQQPIRSPCPLEIQVVHLMAIKCGLLDDCEPSQVGERLDRITSMIQNSSLQSVLAEIAETKRLTATSQAALEGGLAELRTC